MAPSPSPSPSAYLQKQYNLLLSQSNNNTNFQVKYKTANILVSNISESDILKLKILVSRHGMLINVISINVTTSNSTINNKLLAENMSEAISLLSTKKSYGEPFTSAVFGTAKLTINGVADITSELLNDPTENMVKTYTISLRPVTLRGGRIPTYPNPAGSTHIFTNEYATSCDGNFYGLILSSTSAENYGVAVYVWNDENFSSVCTNKYVNSNFGRKCGCTGG